MNDLVAAWSVLTVFFFGLAGIVLLWHYSLDGLFEDEEDEDDRV